MCLTNSLKMPITPWIWNCRPIPHSNAPKAMPKSHLRLSDQLCQLSVAVQSRPWRPNPRVDHPLPKLPSLKHHKLEKPCLLSPSTTDLCIQIDTHTHIYIYVYIGIYLAFFGLKFPADSSSTSNCRRCHRCGLTLSDASSHHAQVTACNLVSSRGKFGQN